MKAEQDDQARASESAAAHAAGALIAAIAFFTRLPTPTRHAWRPEHDRDAPVFAPLIGWIIAAPVIAILNVASLQLPAMVAVGLTMAFSIWFTGAIHEDGFADYCDGFGAPHDKDTTLAIMRDPRTGVFGVVGLVSLLLIKFALLTSMVEELPFAAVVVVLFAAIPLSRFVAIAFMATHRYAREGDETARAGQFATNMSVGKLAFAALWGLGPVVLGGYLVSWSLLWVIPAAALVWVWFAISFVRRLGGYTGDCLGAAQQVSEVVIYLMAASMWLL